MQSSFSELDYAAKKKVTRRGRFLAEMEALVPWSALKAELEASYPAAGAARPLGFLGCCGCTSLSGASVSRTKGIEDAIDYSQAIRRFVGIDLGRESAPDATTLLKLRRRLEKHETTRRIFEVINAHLAERGLLLREGTVVDATIIAAPPSTKNRERVHDPEMHQTTGP